MEGRNCTKCKEYKPWDDFSINSKGKNGRKSVCKSCSNRGQRSLWRKRRKEDPEKWSYIRWTEQLRSAYGLTEEDYFSLLKEQNDSCAICKQKSETKLFVDHCHNTGKNRGLLCRSCNLVLGYAKDDTQVLENAINYLEREYA